MKLSVLIFTALVAANPQAAKASLNLDQHGRGEGGGFAGIVNLLIFGGDVPKTAEEQYVALQGTIQNQINNQLNYKDTAQLVASNVQLITNLNGAMEDFQQQDNATFNAGLKLEKSVVDNIMSGIASTVTTSLDWRQDPQFNPKKPQAFFITNAKGLGSNICLHTQAGNLQEGADIVVDTACELNSYDDKIWSIDNDNRLILRTNSGQFCAAYRSDDGKNFKHDHLGLYFMDSPRCKDGRHIKLLQNGDKSWSLYDENIMLCVADPKWHQFGATLPVIVNPTHLNCYNGNRLEFQQLIPANINAPGAGGSTGNSVTPPQTFDQIGVQIAHFPIIASIHLASIKYQYQFGNSPESALKVYEETIRKYMTWLAAFVPMFQRYCTFNTIDASSDIGNAVRMFESLRVDSINRNGYLSERDGK